MSVDFITGLLQALTYDSAKSAWKRLRGRERSVYDGRRGIEAADVSGKGSVRYDTAGKPYGMAGAGRLDVYRGVVNVTRSNTEGRFEIRLNSLRQSKEEREFLEPLPDRSTRSLTFSFQAKAHGGSHNLVAVVYDADNSGWLASEPRTIKPADWQSHRFALRFDASRPVKVRFDDQDVSHAGSLQLRRLLVTEP